MASLNEVWAFVTAWNDAANEQAMIGSIWSRMLSTVLAVLQ